MATEVSICNTALSYLGSVSTISALTDQTNEAAICDLHFDNTRNALLEEHDWAFARSQATLVEDGGDAPSGWTYVYTLPADCVSPRAIYTDTDPIDFDLVYDGTNTLLVTDEEDAILIYTALVDTVTLFSPLFLNCLAAKLAVEIAIPITRSQSIFSSAMDRYTSALMGVLRADQTARHGTVSRDATWVDER